MKDEQKMQSPIWKDVSKKTAKKLDGIEIERKWQRENPEKFQWLIHLGYQVLLGPSDKILTVG
jgi:hypothetical protein